MRGYLPVSNPSLLPESSQVKLLRRSLLNEKIVIQNPHVKLSQISLLVEGIET
jgi:hypothetical protein